MNNVSLNYGSNVVYYGVDKCYGSNYNDRLYYRYVSNEW